MTVYPVRPEPVPATTAGLTTPEITAILARLDPAALQDAGAAHTELGRELGTMAAHLAQEARTLAQHWTGTAARTALAQFQRLHEQTATLATQASQTGAVLTWLGTQVLPAFQHPAGPAQARDYLTQLTADLIRADASLPTEIGTPTRQSTATTAQRAATGTSNSASTTSIGGVLTTASLGRISSHSSPLNAASTGSNSSQLSPGGTPLTVSPRHPAAPVSSLQSAAPVPSSSPTGVTATPAPTPAATASAPAPVPAPAIPANLPRAATGADTTGAASNAGTTPVTSAATDAETSVPLVPGVSAASSRNADSRDPAGDHEAQPLPAATVPSAHTTTASVHPTPASTLPGLPGTPASTPAPGLTTGAPPLSAQPLPELPTLDSGLSGGALPLPVQPAITTAITSAGALPGVPAPATHGFLPPACGAPTPPIQERHRDSWTTEDRNPWGLPDNCVPPLIEGA